MSSHISNKIDLWSDYKQTNDIDKRNAIFMEYSDLVTKIALRLAPNYRNYIDLDDLISYGNIGLIDAIEKYDINRGVKFETYASIRIRGAIIDEIRKLDWVPRNVRQKFKKVENAMEEVENALGRSATTSELAEHLTISQRELNQILDQMHSYAIISMDDKILELVDEMSASSSNEKKMTPEDMAIAQEVKENLAKAIEDLPERERLIITLYYYEEFTLKEIGRVLDITESRVSQLHARALLKLKEKLSVSS